jgi:serine/threonine protein kinase
MRLIGEGGNALAIYPSIGCSKKTRINKYDYVTKLYKSTETAEEEYKIYSKLPEELNNKLYYKFCELCKIDSNIHSYVDKIVEEYNIKKINYNSLLNIKYIHGVTLYEYLNNFIPIKKFIHLLKLMEILHEDIIKMNELHFYHKDIFSQNVMINFKLDKLFLIDFGRSKYSKKKENIDINNFNKMLEDVLDSGKKNNKIKYVIRFVKKIYSKIDIHFLKLLLNNLIK